jgi:hypothetical protein
MDITSTIESSILNDLKRINPIRPTRHGQGMTLLHVEVSSMFK